MIPRIALAALLLASGCSLGLAQSVPAAPAPKPMTSAPAANTAPDTKQKAVIPPAARSGETGLPGVASEEPIEIKRNK